MEEEKYQKELFEFQKPKRFFPKLSAFFPKGDFERNVILTLTLDRAVFITIGIIMVMVMIYALGIEAGKGRVVSSAQPPVSSGAQAANITVSAAPVVPVTLLQAPKQVQQTKVAASAADNSIKKNTAAVNTNKPYAIVAATFTRKETALQEIDKLKKLGFDATIVQSGRYFQACIGAYADKAGAAIQKDLKKIKRLYKDAYPRLR